MTNPQFKKIASKIARRYLQSARSVPLGVRPGDWEKIIVDLSKSIEQAVKQKSPLAGTGEIGEWLLTRSIYPNVIKPIDSEGRVNVLVTVESVKMPDPIWAMWKQPDRAIVRGGNATRRSNKWGEIVYEMSIYIPSDLTYKMLKEEFLGEGKHSLRWGLRRILAHEFTHLAQKIRKKDRSRGEMSQEEYYNSESEVEARIQEAVHEAEIDAEKYKNSVWGINMLVRKVLDENQVWHRVKSILNAKNKRRFLEAIYTTVDSIEIPEDW